MMRVTIQDAGFEIAISVQASGPYNPDALEDAKNRAVDAFQQALTAKAAISQAIADQAD